ncbi:Hpt domain-containing protein, partial [Pseudomonas sp.]|uniref:Hpt domain-containing protein n=1 Tax=Pseudomonas sp. TaxID=306 RepID=UPI00273625EE
MACGETEHAERLAHSLKGLAGNLGAADLAAQAANLESALKDARHDELDAVLAELEQSLGALVAAIAAQLPEALAAAVAVDEEQLSQLCRQLRRLFAEDDPRAGKIFDEQAELLRSAFNKAMSQGCVARTKLYGRHPLVRSAHHGYSSLSPLAGSCEPTQRQTEIRT